MFDSELNATPMPGGASTRRYFRVALPHDKSAVAMFVPEGAKPEEVQRAHEGTRWPFLEVRDLLAERGIDVPSRARRGHARTAGSSSRTSATTRSPTGSCATPAISVHSTRKPSPTSRRRSSALAELPEGCVVASRTFDYDLLRWEIEHFREWGLDARGKSLAEADATRFGEIADRLAQARRRPAARASFIVTTSRAT